MSRTVMIHFPQHQDDRDSLVHRLRNFGEVVFQQVKTEDWGRLSLAEVDRATTQFAVTEVKASKVRRLVDWINKEAERQHLQIAVEVS